MQKLIDLKCIDTVAVGIDYYDREVSKKATVGRPSAEILSNILKIQHDGVDVSLSTVYDGDLKNILNLVAWSRDSRVFIKILEKVDSDISRQPSVEYQFMVRTIIEYFGLSLRYNHTKKRYYGVFPNGSGVYFFNSHCRLRECDNCTRRYFRVSNEGKTQSCIFPNTPQFSLLDRDSFDKNFRAALSYLGTPPEKFFDYEAIIRS